MYKGKNEIILMYFWLVNKKLLRLFSGIVFLISLKQKFDMYYTDFSYPLANNLTDIENNYSECSKRVKQWGSGFYINFDESKFLSVIKWKQKFF